MQRQPYSGGPVLHHRRRSILMDEAATTSGPIIARRASMPVVGARAHLHHHHDENGEAYRQRHFDEGEKSVPRKTETPYSRSPELRVSHKLAERKRRKEMKELFDELRDSLPVEKNLKTSKWEILSKAVEYISLLKRRDFEMESEVNALRREVGMLKRERGNAGYRQSPY
ncbi:Myc-type, basic helix-loop-helix domain-containing protein [Dichotomocladium elegans]|nr:Myc-type, basic helix-loop-helix domain-containing protein [Dichotomocladium elegans]